MSELAANITARQQIIDLDEPLSTPVRRYRLGAELIEVTGIVRVDRSHTPDGRRVNIKRGLENTAKATHTSGTALEPFVDAYAVTPFAAGEGGGGVTVDNQSDPPAEVTTLIAPGAVIDGEEADLSEVVSLRRSTTTLTHADILDLTSGKEVVPAPGDGKAIDILRITLVSNIVVPYSGFAADGYFAVLIGGQDISLYLNENTPLGVDSVSGVLSGNGFISSGPGMGTDASATTQPGVQLDPADVDNQPATLELSDLGGITGGDAANTLSVSVLYTVVDV